MECMDRFTPLMSRALHFAGNPQGLATPLSDIHKALCELADAEIGATRNEDARLSDTPGRHDDMRLCRFTVYAWVDETLLNSARPDAAAWMGMSLQSRYFETSAAGRDVFATLRHRLNAILTAPEEAALSSLRMTAPETEELPADEKQEGLELAVDLERAAGQPLSVSERELLRVYALCLLYGFCGCFFPYPEVLRRLRASARIFLRATATPPQEEGNAPTPVLAFYRFEPVLYVLVPLFAAAAFALYCADILADIPLNAFSL